jgi:hypothetical protein
MGATWDGFVTNMTPGHTYSMELTTPENQVVCDYGGSRCLTLIGIRHLPSLQEINVHDWHSQHNPPFPVVKLYPGFSLDAVKDSVRDRDPKQYEGYVLVDQYFNRIKIKSESYVFMSSRKDSLQKSNKARVELILADAADDVMPSLPPYIQDKIRGLRAKIVQSVQQIDAMWLTVKGIEGDKDFALKVQHSGLSTPMFAIRKGKAADGLDFFRKTSPKRVLEYIHEKEEE